MKKTEGSILLLILHKDCLPGGISSCAKRRKSVYKVITLCFYIGILIFYVNKVCIIFQIFIVTEIIVCAEIVAVNVEVITKEVNNFILLLLLLFVDI